MENKEVIAGFILFILWVAIMLAWGGSKNIKPDLSHDDYGQQRGVGHPLYQDY